MTLLADDGGKGGVELVEYPLPPTGIAIDIATPYQLNVKQCSCADVNFPCKRKC